MLQSPTRSLSQPNKKTSRLRRFFSSLLAGFRYRIYGLFTARIKPVSESILEGVARDDQDFRHFSFTFALVAISARAACAGGPLTREKYLAFRESFPLKAGICGKIRALFTLACSDQTPLDHYVRQIMYSYPKHDELYTSIIKHLFRIATADGTLAREAERVLASVALMLDIPPATYNQIHSHYAGPVSAHQVLGVKANAKPHVLKQRYHALMRSYHPDRFASDDLSPELQSLLQLKSSEINTAYRILSKRAA